MSPAPPREELRTYVDWIRQGRHVRAGQRAEWYAVAPSGAATALFHADQTDEHHEPDLTRHALVAAEEYLAAKAQPKAPKVRVKAWGPGVAVWCGNQKDIIGRLKKSGWRFDSSQNRWVRDDVTVEKFTEDATAAGIEVVLDA